MYSEIVTSKTDIQCPLDTHIMHNYIENGIEFFLYRNVTLKSNERFT